MGRRRHGPEDVIGKLQQTEVLLAKGAMILKASKATGTTEQTHYQWRRECGGLKVN